MADNHLPPLQDNSNEDTDDNNVHQTRPNTPMQNEDTEQNKRHRTELLNRPRQNKSQRQSSKTGEHVKAINPPPRPRNQGYQQRPRRTRNTPKDSALYLPWWSIALMLVGVIIVSFTVVAAVMFFGGSGRPLAESTPIILIVTAEPSIFEDNAVATAVAPSTQIISGQNAPSSLDLSGPTLAAVQISPTPAAIQLGSVVAVEGVDLNTLNVRSTASLTESSILFRAEEGELFNVIDGPDQSDGFTWWRIQDPNNVNRVGWAVSNFLSVQGS